MGVKPVFKLTTESGKTIRTTANHPYLVKQNKKSAQNANSSESQNDSISFELVPADSIPSQNTLSSVFNVNNYLGRGPAGNRTPETLVPTQSSNHSGPTAFSLYQNNNQKQNYDQQQRELLAIRKIESLAREHGLDSQSLSVNREFSQIRTIWFDQSDQESGQFSPSQHSRRNRQIFEQGIDSIFNTSQRFIARSSNLSQAGSEAEVHNREPDSTLNDSILQDKCSTECINQFSQEKTEWVKVIHLIPGDEIAVFEPSTLNFEQVLWDKVESIEYIGEEQVYDIEVENTHNFIANDILAHNTYLSGNVGIGTTSPAAPLEVLGDFRVAEGTNYNTLFVDATNGNVGVGTASPNEKLDVNGHIRALAGNSLRVQNSSSNSHAIILNPAASGESGLRFSSGVAAMDILHSGNIGIGDADPDAVLEVSASNGASDLFKLSFNDDNDGNLFIVKNSGNVGIGTTSPEELLHLSSTDSNEPVFKIENINADASAAHFKMYKTSSSAADGDDLGMIEFYGRDSAGGYPRYAYIQAKSSSITNDDEIGRLVFAVATDDTAKIMLDMEGDAGGGVGLPEVTFNQDGVDADFRIESDTDTHAFFLEGSSGNVGIGTTTPDEALMVVGTIKAVDSHAGGGIFNTGKIQLADASSNQNFTIDHSVSTSLTTFANGVALDTAGFVFNPRAGVEAMRILGTGNVGIGTESPEELLELVKESANPNLAITAYHDTETTRGSLVFRKADGSAASPGLVDDNAILGRINAVGYDGSDFVTTGAFIKFQINGTPAADKMPTDIEFGTADGVISNSVATKMIIKNDGNIGIGTTTPDTQLSIVGSGDAVVPLSVVGNSSDQTGNLLEIGEYATATPSFVITSAGNLGIGTTSPDVLLHIGDNVPGTVSGAEDVMISGMLEVDNVAYFDSWIVARNSTYINDDKYLYFGSSGNSYIKYDSANDKTDFFDVGAGAGMTIDNTGNLGIGTTSPDQLLEVWGTNPVLRASTNVNTELSSVSADVLGSTQIQLRAYGTSHSGTVFGEDTATAKAIYATGGGTGKWFYVGSNDGGMKFATDDIVRATIDSSGNMGIGTTTPFAEFAIHAGNDDAQREILFAVASSTASATSTHFVVTNDGNVGIGTTSPWAQLSVNPDGISGPSFAIGSSTQTDFVVMNNGNSGNVGIGTANPGKALDVTTTSGVAAIRVGGGSDLGELILANSGTNQWHVQGGANFRIRDAGTADVFLIEDGANANSFYINSDGNVGIGTTTPDATLAVTASAGSLTGDQFLFQVASTTDTSMNDVFVVTADGNVGIGTASPDKLLHVEDDVGVTNKITLRDNSGYSWSNAPYIAHDQAAGPDDNDFIFVSPINSGFLFDMKANAAGDSFLIRVPDGLDGTPDTNAFKVQADGNVGIGTTSPDALLDIGKTAASHNDLFMISSSTAGDVMTVDRNGNLGIGTSSPKAVLEVDGDVRFAEGANYDGFFYDATNARLGLGTTPSVLLDVITSGNAYMDLESTGSEARLHVHAPDGYNSFVRFDSETVWAVGIDDSNSDTFTISQNADLGTNDYLAINTNGNVGIGTTSPSQLLTLESSDASKPNFLIENTNADDNAAVITMRKRSTSAADGDKVLQIEGQGYDSTSDMTTYAAMYFRSDDVTGGDESGYILFQTRMDNAMYNMFTIDSYNGTVGQGDIIFNDEAQDMNFRVEGVGQANALFVQGSSGNVGIGTTTPDATLAVTADAGSVTGNQFLFQVSSTTNSTINNILMVTADGNVGIGTSAPTSAYISEQSSYGSLLHIGDAASIRTVIAMTDNVGTRELVSDNNQFKILKKLTASTYHTDFLVDTNGNVGIGTTSPTYELEVYSALPEIFADSSSATGNSWLYFGQQGTRKGWIGYRNAQGVTISGDGTNDHWVMDANGNVGIGSTSPSYLLGMEDQAGQGGFYDASTNAFTTGPSFSWLKQDREELSIEETLNILASTTIETFKFIAEIEEVGDGADTHIGIILDEAHDALSTHKNGDITGYNPMRTASVAFKGVQILTNIFNIQNAPTTTSSLIIDSNGNFGIATDTPTNILTIGQGMGNPIADGWSVYSSEQYKTDITYLEEEEYEDILKEIKDMNLAKYRYKKDKESGFVESSTEESKLNLGVIAEEVPEQVLSEDKMSVSLYDYASFALAGVKAVKSELDELKNALGVVENEDGTLEMTEEENDIGILVIKSEDGTEYQLTLDNEGYVVLDKVRVKDLELVSGGQFTIASGENEIMGSGKIVKGLRYSQVDNNKITEDSKIFISFTSNLGGNNWWVCEKEEGEYFRLCIGSPAEKLITFDYWIIEARNIKPETWNMEQETMNNEEEATTTPEVIIEEAVEETATTTEEVIAEEVVEETATSTDEIIVEEEPIIEDISTTTEEIATTTPQ